MVYRFCLIGIIRGACCDWYEYSVIGDLRGWVNNGRDLLQMYVCSRTDATIEQ